MLFVLPREFRLLRVRFRGSRRFCEEQREEDEEERERRSASISSSRIAHGWMRAFARFFPCVCVCVCARTEERACFFEEIYTQNKTDFITQKRQAKQPAGANRRRRNSLKSQRDGFKIKQRGADDFTLPHLSGFYFLSFFFFRNEHDWIDIRRF